MFTMEQEYNINQVLNSQWSAVTPIYGVSSSLRKAQRKVTELSNLSENWDSYGSSSIQPPAIEMALKILSLVDRQGVATPQIFPVSGGGIQLEWQSGSRELELEILPNGMLEYLVVDEQKNMQEGSLPAQEEYNIYSLINKWVK
jgi:hypothetical protein